MMKPQFTCVNRFALAREAGKSEIVKAVESIPTTAKIITTSEYAASSSQEMKMRCETCGHVFYLKEIMRRGSFKPQCPRCYSRKLEKLNSEDIECQHCGYKWQYNGTAEFHTTCPICRYKVRARARASMRG